MWLFAFIASLGFGILYAHTAFAYAMLSTALMLGGIAFGIIFVSFVLPPQLYRYTNVDAAPRVQTQVINRAILGAFFVLALNISVWLALGGGESLLEELYAYTLLAIFVFHGWAGAIALHIVYLQQTHQYNSNQLVAVIGLVTLGLFVLVLFLIALDWGIVRDAYIHRRDVILITLIMLGYGRAVYLMAHH
jgi:hypothetical protein